MQKNAHLEVLTKIQYKINQIFYGLNDCNFLDFCNFDAIHEKNNLIDWFISLILHCGHFFNRVLLRCELIIIYETNDLSTTNNAK